MYNRNGLTVFLYSKFVLFTPPDTMRYSETLGLNIFYSSNVNFKTRFAIDFFLFFTFTHEIYR